MNEHEAGDTLGEVHRELDQLSRVTIAALLQVSEVAARRGTRRAAARRDEQVAMAKAAAAQLEADYAEAIQAGPSGTAPAAEGTGPELAADLHARAGAVGGNDIGAEAATGRRGRERDAGRKCGAGGGRSSRRSEWRRRRAGGRPRQHRHFAGQRSPVPGAPGPGGGSGSGREGRRRHGWRPRAAGGGRGGRAGQPGGARLTNRCAGPRATGPVQLAFCRCQPVASCFISRGPHGWPRRTLPRPSRSTTPPVQAAATTRLRSGFPSGAAHGLCLPPLGRGSRAWYHPSSTRQEESY